MDWDLTDITIKIGLLGGSASHFNAGAVMTKGSFIFALSVKNKFE